MTKALCAPAQTSAGRSKPTYLACSRSVMCARVRSSALPRPSERAHRSLRHCTPFSRNTATEQHSPPTPGDTDVRRMHPYRHHSRRDAKRARLRGMLEDPVALGPFAFMPNLRPCRLLRRLTEPSAIAPRRTTARSRASIESAVELLRPVVGERKRNRKAITPVWIAELRELQMHRRERQWTLLDGLIDSAPISGYFATLFATRLRYTAVALHRCD